MNNVKYKKLNSFITYVIVNRNNSEYEHFLRSDV